MRPSQPHDSFIKWAFKQAPHAAGLLRAVLSKEELAAVDLTTLRVEDGSYVEPALSQLHSDLVLSAEMYGERVYFYALVEHQRDMEARMVLRIGKYTLSMWDNMARDPGLELLPPILPIVIYNGRRPWTAPTAFQDLVRVPEPARESLSRHIPRFEVRLVDLQGGRTEDLVESALTALGRVVLWCLSVAGDDERLDREMGRILGSLEEVLHARDAAGAAVAILRYLGATHPNVPADKLRAVVDSVSGPEAREAIVDIFERLAESARKEARKEALLEGRMEGLLQGKEEGLLEGKKVGLLEGKKVGLLEGKKVGLLEGKKVGLLEGKKEGKKEGRREALSRTLLDMMTHRFGPVSRSVRKRVLEADEAALRRWVLQVLNARTVEDVIADSKADRPAAPGPRASRPARAARRPAAR